MSSSSWKRKGRFRNLFNLKDNGSLAICSGEQELLRDGDHQEGLGRSGNNGQSGKCQEMRLGRKSEGT